MASLKEQILRRKPVGVMTDETGTDAHGGEGEGELARSIGLFQLTLFGVGATIGTGIFIVLTQAVPVGGPAVILSFVMAGTVAGLTAICYAELASAVPVSGSSYSYAYATLGEGIAIVVAACLLLEYGVSAAAVAVGWSQYLNELLDNLFGFTIPTDLAQAPEQGGIFNVPAVILIVLCTLLLLLGASESAKVNAIMVMIKLGVLALFIMLGLKGWSSDNLSDFAPAGVNGITSAAGIIFFSYIGLDAVSTAGEEVRNPRSAPYTVAVGTEADESMFTEWSEQMEEAGREALDRVEDLPAVPRELETAIGRGESWEEALEDIEWEDGDVLVVGSSTIGPVARVFLGSRGAKIVRHSPVPVVVVPRGAAEELAEEAQSGG